MSKFRCIIADDEPLAVRLLESYCRRIDSLEVVGAFTSASKALEAICAGDVDLAILDIQMPHLTGIELARVATESGTQVIFVTAYRDYAFEGFQVHAADYLLKPVSFEEFSEAIARVASRLSSSVQNAAAADDYLTVRSDYRQVRIPVADILYIEGLKDYVKIFVTDRDRPVLTQMSMKATEAQLPADRFMRVHRSYIVALRHIEAFDRSSLTVAATTVPVGDTFRARFLEVMER